MTGRTNFLKISNLDVDSSRSRAIENLKHQASHLALCQVPPLEHIDNFSVSNEIFKQTGKTIKESLGLPSDGNQIIYIISFSEPISAERLEDIIAEYEAAKEQDTEGFRQITGINMKNKEKQMNRLDEVVLYVGTSKSFAKRVQEHVGYGSKGTASICLRKWPAFYRGDVKLKFSYLNFGKEMAPESLKLIEFDISSELAPLLGHNRKS